MGVPAAAQRIFDFSRPAVKELERQIVTTVRTFSEDHEYLFVSWLKSLESFSEKLETGRFKSVSGVVDLFGCTVVVPTAAHEQTVIDFLNGVYICEDVRDRSSAQKAPDVFRFDATRYVGRFKPQPGVTYSPNIDKYLFEVQIRTIFEYAWSVVTHDLVYKADEIDWRRLRLAAQLKAAVEQIEMIIAAFESSAEAIAVSPSPEIEAQVEVLRRFKEWIAQGRIVAELKPASWSRFGQSITKLVRSYARRADVRVSVKFAS